MAYSKMIILGNLLFIVSISFTAVITGNNDAGIGITDGKGCPCFDPNAPKNSAPKSNSRIIGGVPVDYISQRPWQVALYYNNEFICGGSLVGCESYVENIPSTGDTRTSYSSRHVVTAAHCVVKKNFMNDSTDLVDPSKITVFHSSVHLGKGIPVKVSKIRPYNPEFYFQLLAEDIAILELDRPVKWTRNARAICYQDLPTENPDLSGMEAIASGWGRTSRNGNISSQLKMVNLKILSYKDCVVEAKKANVPSHLCDYMLCANTTGTNIEDGVYCGDSGGPLDVCYSPNHFLTGVTSFGGPGRLIDPPTDSYDVYTRVSYFVDWINDVVYKTPKPTNQLSTTKEKYIFKKINLSNREISL